MDYLNGSAWVRFVTECTNDIRAGCRLFGRTPTIIVIRNRWSFIGSREPRSPRLCTANDNSLPNAQPWVLGEYRD